MPDSPTIPEKKQALTLFTKLYSFLPESTVAVKRPHSNLPKKHPRFFRVAPEETVPNFSKGKRRVNRSGRS